MLVHVVKYLAQKVVAERLLEKAADTKYHALRKQRSVGRESTN